MELTKVIATLADMARDGGGTLDLTTGEAATLESGYFVGGAGGWEPFIMAARPEAYADDNMAEVFAEFVETMARRLNGRGYIGAWEHNGSIYLDATEWFAEEWDALEAGRVRDEIAIWDIAKGDEITC